MKKWSDALKLELRRGDVVKVAVSPADAEAGVERHAMVLSPSVINEYSPIVLVAAVVARKTDRVFPFEAGIEPANGGVTRTSKVLCTQLRSIEKSRIAEVLGAVDADTLHRVDDALMIAVGLTPI